VTELLPAWNHGDQGALDQLMALVLWGAAPAGDSSSLQENVPATRCKPQLWSMRPTSGLIDTKKVSWGEPWLFFSAPDQLMRRILVDCACRPSLRQARGRCVQAVAWGQKEYVALLAVPAVAV